MAGRESGETIVAGITFTCSTNTYEKNEERCLIQVVNEDDDSFLMECGYRCCSGHKKINLPRLKRR